MRAAPWPSPTGGTFWNWDGSVSKVPRKSCSTIPRSRTFTWGARWALLAGGGFGLFQALNRRAIQGMDVYTSTFLQLLVSTVVLAAVSLVTQDLGLLRTAPPLALFYFGLAGFVPFFAGWPPLNASQKRIGAARTSPLIGTTPLFGTIIAALVLREIPGALALGGILLTVAGVYTISSARAVAPEGITVADADMVTTSPPDWRGGGAGGGAGVGDGAVLGDQPDLHPARAARGAFAADRRDGGVGGLGGRLRRRAVGT